MSEPPNHRETDCQRCDTCDHSNWGFIASTHIDRCDKHNCHTKAYMVCDDWEAEK